MLILGTIINALAVLLGGLAGLMLHARLPQRYVTALFQAIGLFTLALGMMMALRAQEWLLVVLSLILGALTGELLRMENFFEGLAGRIGKRTGAGGSRFNQGLLTAFLLFCMGSMTILGAVEEGISGERSLYYVKSLMDGISAIALASGLGIGVLFSVVPLFIYQAGLTLLAAWFGASMPELMIDNLTATGGIILLGLGFNILQVTKISVLNLLPALIFAVVTAWIFPHF
ncbi:MAG TPA: DUF554 domain-containing protein [Bacteroidales bacterium]|nr:DUF554 domain-containing protein [Bacteroidales bacterium]